MGWLRFVDGRREPRPEELHPAAQLCRILRRERELADGFKGGFSLLVLTPPDQGSGPALLTPLLRILQRRLRYSDEVGWMDEEQTRIGVVMHRTPGWGAWKVADDICAALPAGSPRPSCEVFCYPFQPADDKSRREDAAHGVPECKRPVSEMEPLLLRAARPQPRELAAVREEKEAAKRG